MGAFFETGNLKMYFFMKAMLTLVVLIFCCSSCGDKLTSMAKGAIDDEELLKHIVPYDENVQYWEINYLDGQTKVLASFGNLGDEEPNKLKFYHNSFSGFFTGCQPLLCSYRIVFLKDGSWNFVESIEELKTFIGKVENVQEAFLLARMQGFRIDEKSDGNGYLKTEKGYKLKVMKYKSCPESKESFNVFINSDEIVSVSSNGFYYSSGDCIVY